MVGLTYLPIETEPARGPYHTITTGTASDNRKLFAYNHLVYADAFSTCFGPWPLLAPAKSGSTRSVTQNSSSSSSKDSSQYLDRFLELTGDYAPPAINSWFHANAVKVNRFSAKYQQRKHLPSDANYFFPDPHIFLDVSNRGRTAYLHMWKQISSFWKYRASCNKPDARPLSSEEWRDLLGIPLKASTESEIRKQVKIFLGPSPDSKGVSYHLNASDFNLPIEKKEALELVWEICEPNFRFELLSLDVRAAARSPRSQSTGDEYFQAESTFRIERQTKFGWCFPDAFSSPQSARADYGISSTHWSRRFKRLKYLRKLMEGWADPPRREVMTIRPEVLEKESRVSVEWEQGLVQHYVQTFYDYFGRPAILPRRLPAECQPVSRI
ncbi:uncharacterized protein EV420DRAFT_1535650 [Desarmillaria tabescens]|uniref:Uncharacterized protein n=1 Tax=Armillaria tabescens TaxID=1929756 RepID=A0AA39N6Q3_ARMTA|nr:uncharacterized protein EV420DRAFT_1535650 [Desarmillaria tabescens]KAK0460216.1 hypothetical protein EV420DRAFT_1535650 [Desarmillaria tabescens]